MDDESVRSALESGRRAGESYALLRPDQTPAGLMGEQLGKGVGSSIEFMDYREYEPGDDLRRVDWSAYARSDRLMVKLHREEVTPHLDLVVDASASMALEGTAKGAATLGLVAALASAADNARMTRRLYAAADRLDVVPGGEGEVAGWVWPGFEGGGGEGAEGRGLLAALHRVAVPMRGRGVRVLVSDLLYADDPWPIVSRLAEGASALVVVQLLAGVDADPGWSGDVRLVDCEDGVLREVRIDATTLRRYRERLDQLRGHWRSACARVGARMVEVIAEELVEGWDLRGMVRAELLRMV